MKLSPLFFAATALIALEFSSSVYGMDHDDRGKAPVRQSLLDLTRKGGEDYLHCREELRGFLDIDRPAALGGLVPPANVPHGDRDAFVEYLMRFQPHSLYRTFTPAMDADARRAADEQVIETADFLVRSIIWFVPVDQREDYRAYVNGLLPPLAPMDPHKRLHAVANLARAYTYGREDREALRGQIIRKQRAHNMNFDELADFIANLDLICVQADDNDWS